MMLRAIAIAIAAAVASPGCRAARPSATPSVAAPTPFDDWRYREGAPSEAAKIFLVAGGDDVANFAAEIVEQRRLWLRAGVSPDEIACYWARPPPRAYKEDRAQYDALASQLRDCFRADPATVLGHLQRAAEHSPPWIYVFVSAHGLPPLMRWQAQTRDAEIAARRLGLSARDMAVLDQHAIGLQAGPGPRLEEVAALLVRYREGRPIRELMFSPTTLAEALAALPPTTPKFVVLQACFSGGFIGRPKDEGGPSPLAAIGSLTLLTATSWDRPSFGCEPGSARTYFGGTFNRVLAVELEPDRRPPDLDWARIHDRVAFVIDVMESIDAERASSPGFFHSPSDPDCGT